jgi:hypothetical protein
MVEPAGVFDRIFVARVGEGSRPEPITIDAARLKACLDLASRRGSASTHYDPLDPVDTPNPCDGALAAPTARAMYLKELPAAAGTLGRA